VISESGRSGTPQHSASTPPNASGAMAMPQDLWHRTVGASRCAVRAPSPGEGAPIALVDIIMLTGHHFRRIACIAAAERSSQFPDGDDSADYGLDNWLRNPENVTAEAIKGLRIPKRGVDS
jgi:hypothetical protein